MTVVKTRPSIAFLSVDFLGNKSYSINYYIGMLLHYAAAHGPEGKYTLYSHKGSDGPSYTFEEIMRDYRIDSYPPVEVKQLNAYEPGAKVLDEIAGHDLIVCTIYFWGDALEELRRRNPHARILYWVPSVLWHEYIIVKQTKWYQYDLSLESQRKAVAAADHVMFNSESDRLNGLRYFGKLVRDSSAAFPIPLVSEQPRPRPIPDQDGKGIIFGTAGRWEYRKGFQFIIEAFFRYYAEHGTGRLRIMSQVSLIDSDPGVAMDPLTVRKLRYLQAQGAIELTDWSKERSVYTDFLQSCDVMVLPSLYDPFNIIGYDCLSLEIPLILSTFCGIEEVIDEGPFLHKINPLDLDSLYESMTQMEEMIRRHPGKQPGHQIKHTWAGVMQQTFELYNRIQQQPALLRTA
jgi:glycosyltransferase involved in cell wall biosynthesis